MLEDIGDVRMCIELINLSSKAGGGALPLLDLPSKCVGVKVQGMSANNIEKQMRENRPPVIGRIEEDFFIMDLRTIQDDELAIIETAFNNMLRKAN